MFRYSILFIILSVYSFKGNDAKVIYLDVIFPINGKTSVTWDTHRNKSDEISKELKIQNEVTGESEALEESTKQKSTNEYEKKPNNEYHTTEDTIGNQNKSEQRIISNSEYNKTLQDKESKQYHIYRITSTGKHAKGKKKVKNKIQMNSEERKKQNSENEFINTRYSDDIRAVNEKNHQNIKTETKMSSSPELDISRKSNGDDDEEFDNMEMSKDHKTVKIINDKKERMNVEEDKKTTNIQRRVPISEDIVDVGGQFKQGQDFKMDNRDGFDLYDPMMQFPIT